MKQPSKRVRILGILSVTVATAVLSILPPGAWAKDKEKVLYGFTNGSDGGLPVGNLVFDKAGNLYGVTVQGGANGLGTVFKLTPANGVWTETVLHSFRGGSDGSSPKGTLIFDQAGNLYGATYGGGGNGCFAGCGTVFKLTPVAHDKWTETVLYVFTGGADGASPQAGLVADTAGNLYGTTYQGGNASCATGGCGTVFELTPGSGKQWTETVLHAFTAGRDGAYPFAGLIFDNSGNLYGTASLGGQPNGGIVFALTPGRGGKWNETVIHAFKGGRDGFAPASGLALFRGSLYGTTYNGGDDMCGLMAGCGTVFQMKSSAGGKWTENVIHRFRGSDGLESFATPVLDRAGNLYGTTFEGGSGVCDFCGTAFELTPSVNGHWQETVLHDFGSRSGDAGTPEGGLILDKTGNLFGTTAGGGTVGYGTVYEITPTKP
jgi:uncharacterized repeat protein (TIGR03803 family)